MRKITVTVTALALALSMLAQTAPVAAAAGYDSAYAGESAFVNLSPGQSNEFQVFFANTGTATWTVGTASQVDLAACLEDKVTCNAQDATEAPWNAGWKSSTRYATTTQTSVAPGSVATFKYTVTAPAGVAAGTYRFNGDLVVASTGERIHPEGYYQEATVGTSGGAATLTSLTPATGTNAGGTTVVIAGSGFVCTPSFPSVLFGSTSAAVTSCGATSITTTSPAGAVGAVTVTATNSGAAASNGLTFTYADTTKPTYTGVTAAGTLATVTFDEPVCRTAIWAATDWEVTVNGVSATYEDSTDFIPACNGTFTNGVTSANLVLAVAAPNGSFVAVTLNATGGAVLRDTAGNTATAPRSNTTYATTPETTKPTITTVTGVQGTSTLTINFSEPVFCAGILDAGDITAADGTNPALLSTANTCPATAALAATSFDVTLSGPLLASTTYTVTVTADAATDELTDVVGNDIASPATATFTSGPADFTPPTLTDTRVSATVGSTDIGQTGDAFKITFSEAMGAIAATDTITLTDSDGTNETITCTGVAAADTVLDASCVLDTTSTILTVTLLEDALPANFEVAGSIPNIQLPTTITSTAGITDASSNAPNLAGSADRVIDIE